MRSRATWINCRCPHGRRDDRGSRDGGDPPGTDHGRADDDGAGSRAGDRGKAPGIDRRKKVLLVLQVNTLRLRPIGVVLEKNECYRLGTGEAELSMDTIDKSQTILLVSASLWSLLIISKEVIIAVAS